MIVRGMKRSSLFFFKISALNVNFIGRKLDPVDKAFTYNICFKINLITIHIKIQAENIVKRCNLGENKLFHH